MFGGESRCRERVGSQRSGRGARVRVADRVEGRFAGIVRRSGSGCFTCRIAEETPGRNGDARGNLAHRGLGWAGLAWAPRFQLTDSRV